MASSSGVASAVSVTPNCAPDHSGTSGDRAATVSAASVAGSRSSGEPTRATRSAGANHWRVSPLPELVGRRRAVQTSSGTRSPVRGTTASSRSWPSPLPTKRRSTARHASSPLPLSTGNRSSAPVRHSPTRPCATATSATSRSPRRSRPIPSAAATSSAVMARCRASVPAGRSANFPSSVRESRAAAAPPLQRGRTLNSQSVAVISERLSEITSVTRSQSGSRMTGIRSVRPARSTWRSIHGVSRAGSTSARSRRAASDVPASAARSSTVRTRSSIRCPPSSGCQTVRRRPPSGMKRSRQRPRRWRSSPAAVSKYTSRKWVERIGPGDGAMPPASRGRGGSARMRRRVAASGASHRRIITGAELFGNCARIPDVPHRGSR